MFLLLLSTWGPVTHWLYGATAARLTPDQKVGSSNLSVVIFLSGRWDRRMRVTSWLMLHCDVYASTPSTMVSRRGCWVWYGTSSLCCCVHQLQLHAATSERACWPEVDSIAPSGNSAVGPGVAWAFCRLPPSARSWCRPGQMWWPGVTLAGCVIWHDRSKTRHEHDPGRTRTCKLRFGGRRLIHYAMGLSEAQTTQDAR